MTIQVMRLLLIFVACLPLSVLAAPPAAPTSLSTTNPAHKLAEQFWTNRHAAIVKRAKEGDAGMIVIGDSIVHSFDGPTWKKFYEPRNAMNLGYWCDQTENVLWRLDNGEIDGISPKVAMVMIGTNNSSSGATPEEIFEGIKAICGRLRAKLPTTKILLLAIFPRGKDVQDPLRLNNEAANTMIAKLADNKDIFFMNINDKFLAPDGTVRKDLMPDLLHPKQQGCQVWAESVEPMVASLMGDAEK